MDTMSILDGNQFIYTRGFEPFMLTMKTGALAGLMALYHRETEPIVTHYRAYGNLVGIHGTGDDASIGTRASHGCIRMHVSDVVDLDPRVPVGTKVLIK